jgi:membrane protease YdiL (CAAX protease family)
MFILFTIVAGIGEEFGWRGYLLPRLQTRHNALVSGLIVGVIWAIWHIPLFFLKGMSQNVMQLQAGLLPALLGYSVLVIVNSIQFTWVFNNTRGSVLLAAVLHGASNAWAGSLMSTGKFRQGHHVYGCFSAVSILIVLIAGRAPFRTARGVCFNPR